MISEAPSQPTLLTRAYSDRQMIVVADDAVVAALDRAESRTSESPRRNNASVEVVSLGVGITLELPLADLVTGIAEAVADLVKMWRRAGNSGLHVLPVGKSQARQLTFPPGHPRSRVIYVGHPAVPEVYCTIADFHRVTFQHKFSEAIDLLMHLGATSIRVEHVRGWSKEFSTLLSVPLGQAGTVGTGEARAAGRSDSHLLYEATLSGASEPTLPDSLVWYPHEPTWQSVAKGRISFRLREFSLMVTYDDDFGVNAGLKALAFKSGFEVGGKFEDHEATTWRIAGRFHPGDQVSGAR